MFTALKKLTKLGEDRSSVPVPMSSALQKRFSRGVHYNMKILIKGDRNVGKSCLLQRLQGGPFIEEYEPTEQIQVAPIHWSYKNTDHIVKVEVWEVVDKGKAKKKPPLGLKLENQSIPASEDGIETPVLDATFLDVYKSATGVILMFDITKPWTFDYVVKELSRAPADLPVVILGNHCDMQHHRQVHAHHIQQAVYQAKSDRTAPVRYAESSMRNGFGLRLLHKFLSVPFLRLQRTTLLEQLQRNQADMDDTEQELDSFQSSEESQYEVFVDRLADKRRQKSQEARPTSDRSPSIVIGAGKPIIPPNVNPLLAQSLNPMGIKAQHNGPPQCAEREPEKQTQFVDPDLLNSTQLTQKRTSQDAAQRYSEKNPSSPVSSIPAASKGPLDDFYAGALDSSFLDDLPTPFAHTQEANYESDSDNDAVNPMVAVDQDDVDVEYEAPLHQPSIKQQPPIKQQPFIKQQPTLHSSEEDLPNLLADQLVMDSQMKGDVAGNHVDVNDDIEILYYNNKYPIWAGDSSGRRSPEGDENPDSLPVEVAPDKLKKHKKKKSKDKDAGAEKSEKKLKKHKKSKAEKSLSTSAMQGSTGPIVFYNGDEYDSI